jgi:hypothetical protein
MATHVASHSGLSWSEGGHLTNGSNRPINRKVVDPGLIE